MDLRGASSAITTRPKLQIRTKLGTADRSSAVIFEPDDVHSIIPKLQLKFSDRLYTFGAVTLLLDICYAVLLSRYNVLNGRRMQKAAQV